MSGKMTPAHDDAQIVRGTSGGTDAGSVPLITYLDEQQDAHQRLHQAERQEVASTREQLALHVSSWQELHDHLHKREREDREKLDGTSNDHALDWRKLHLSMHDAERSERETILKSVEMAQGKFEEGIVHRLEQTNKWREQLNEERGHFARMADVRGESVRTEGLLDRIDGENERRWTTISETIAELQRGAVVQKTQLAELQTISKDVRELRDYQQSTMGKNTIIVAIVSIGVSIGISLVVGLAMLAIQG